MKKKYKILIYSLFIMGLIVILTNSCKKDEEDKPIVNPPVVTPTLTASKQNVNQLEIITLTPSNITLVQTSYSGTIGGQSVTLNVADNKLVFVMSGTLIGNQTLSIPIGGNTFSIIFTVNEVATIADPVTYYGNTITTLTQQKNELETSINQMAGIIDMPNSTQDIQIIQNFINTSIQNFQTASSADQAQVVKFIEANKPWLEELAISITTLNISIDNLIYAKKSKGPDYEAIFKTASIEFVQAVMKVRLAIAGLACVLLPPPFGEIAAPVVIANFIYRFYNVLIKEEVLLDIVKGIIKDISEEKKAKSMLSFSNNTSKIIQINGRYRNYNSVDKNTSFSIIKQFVNSMQSFSDAYKYMNNILSLTGTITSPKVIEDCIIEKTTNLTVNANYLSISNISNPKVTGNAQNINGDFSLTFQTIENSNQTFNFDIVYKNDGIASFSKTITGATLLVIPSAYSISIVSGNNQSGISGSQLANPIKVIVKDQSGNPSSGVNVHFTANNGGYVSQTQITTGADGTATVNWTLGSTGTTQTTTVTAYKNDNVTPLQGSPLTFNATSKTIKELLINKTWSLYYDSSNWCGVGVLNMTMVFNSDGTWLYNVCGTNYNMNYTISGMTINYTGSAGNNSFNIISITDTDLKYTDAYSTRYWSAN